MTGYQVATFMAWLVSVIFAYVINKLYVFHAHSCTKKQMIGEIFFILKNSQFINRFFDFKKWYRYHEYKCFLGKNCR